MNSRHPSNPICRAFVAGLCGLLCSGSQAAADSIPYTFTKVGPEYRLTLPTDPNFYYGFQHTNDLLRFSMRNMAMGSRTHLRLHARGGRNARVFPRQAHQHRRARGLGQRLHR
jgi:hypothetical protein